ncbi:MAG: hypothetical protein WC480_02455 [Patescibacteria group bacterium]
MKRTTSAMLVILAGMVLLLVNGQERSDYINMQSSDNANDSSSIAIRSIGQSATETETILSELDVVVTCIDAYSVAYCDCSADTLLTEEMERAVELCETGHPAYGGVYLQCIIDHYDDADCQELMDCLEEVSQPYAPVTFSPTKTTIG